MGKKWKKRKIRILLPKPERLDNEINLPSSLPYRRKHFKKLNVRLFSEDLEPYENRFGFFSYILS